MTDKENAKLEELYGIYNETIKLLIAEIEALTQKFPIEVFNEIRAFTDHIARCYLPVSMGIDKGTELRKAESHIIRITFDCYKHLNVAYFEKLRLFLAEDGTGVDYRDIENGEFFKNIWEGKEEAEKLSFEARKLESIDKNASLGYWQKLHVHYSLLFTYIKENDTNITWARSKFKREVDEVKATAAATAEKIKKAAKKSKRVERFFWILGILVSWAIGHFTISDLRNVSNRDALNEDVEIEQVEVIEKDYLVE